MKINIILLVFILFGLPSCIYDFEPDNLKYENKLVVYGLVTNGSKPLEVYLSRTVDINSNTIIAESNAQVEIIDGAYQSVQLTEIEDGKYSSVETFEGVINEKYKIIIETQNGKRYESDYEILNEPVDVGNIYYEFVKKETADIDNPIWGCQFYVDVEVKNGKYLRYEMDETWEIKLPYQVIMYWNRYIGWVRPDIEDACWKQQDIGEFYLVNPTEYGSGTISELPLTFVTNETSRLLYKYCLNVKQYTMSEKTNIFWKSQSDNLGQNSLYTKQPYQVVGNIKNIDNPDEIVLGIFEASGVSNRRVFVENNYGGENEFATCELRNPPTWRDQSYGYYYVTMIDGKEGAIDKNCIICEEKGASSVMPDFWE